MIRALLLATILVGIGACGQKGPLKLPEPSAPKPAAFAS
jgi:predicted small lipoprotein YifL